MNQEEIGKFIKQIRLDNNLTQKELADKLGVTYQAVSKWENGKNVPDIQTLQNISKEFNTNIDEILNGKKESIKDNNFKNKKFITLIIILLIIGLIISFGVKYIIKEHIKESFEFKIISSKCSNFKLNGSAAYNKDKTAIYISNIEFCGKEDNEIYKKINCTLYEINKDTKIKVSSCDTKKNINLENFLKGTSINVDNYSKTCKNLTSNSLILEIEATTTENKTTTYKVPLKINDSCK